MKLLRLIPSMNPAAGGPCQGIRNLIPALQSLGCDNEVACMDAPGETFGMQDSFVVHRTGKSYGPWAMSRELRPWLRENLARYDAVIVHGLWQYHSYALTKTIAELKGNGTGSVPRSFVMPHGALDPWFQRDRSRRLKAIRNYWVWKLVEQHVISQADAVLFTCQKELELAREPFRPYLPRGEINVGYGIAEPPSFALGMAAAFTAVAPQLDGKPYLLFLSRIHPKKGVDLLLQAYAQIQRLAGSVSLPALVIAGPLESTYAGQMLRLAAELNLKNVHFPGMLQGDAKWGAFYGCKAFVLPSHQENFGIAVVEAMACGKPALISDQVNICQEIESDHAGLVGRDTLAGVTDVINRFLQLSAGERAAMGENARRCFVKRFGVHAAAETLLRALE